MLMGSFRKMDYGMQVLLKTLVKWVKCIIIWFDLSLKCFTILAMETSFTVFTLCSCMKPNTNIVWAFLCVCGGGWFSLTVLNMHIKLIEDLLQVCVYLICCILTTKTVIYEQSEVIFAKRGYFGWSPQQQRHWEDLAMGLGLRLELGLG